MGKRRLGAAAVALLGAVVAAATALGAGPDPGVSRTGPTLGKVHYVASPGAVTTVVRAVNGSGRVLRSVTVGGNMGFPLVAFDGTVEGLSADGRTLVVAPQRNTMYRKSSSFAVLDVPSLKVRRLIRLQGDFSYDALSPHGQTLYLVEHMSANDVLRYRVRAYDLRAGRLLEEDGDGQAALAERHDRCADGTRMVARQALGVHVVRRGRDSVRALPGHAQRVRGVHRPAAAIREHRAGEA